MPIEESAFFARNTTMPSFWDAAFDLAGDYLRGQQPTDYTGSLVSPYPIASSPGGGMVTTNGGASPAMPANGKCGPRPVYRFVNGRYQWTFPTRKRRKRLAPPSVIRDLAALKTVLKPGQMDTYIATHPC